MLKDDKLEIVAYCMDIENLPKHVAIIPDGNRRWARKKGLAVFLGHQHGAEVFESIVKTAFEEFGISHLTFWGSSKDNIIKRSREEVDFLFKIFKNYFKKLAADKSIHKNQVKINVFGQWQRLYPKNLKKTIQEAIDKTKDYKKFNLNFMLAYNGDDEMVEAIKKIAKQKEKNPNLEVDENLVKKSLWTKNLPPVDLVIRTGGEPHWSVGFMMWDCANSQLYFTEKLYPDFAPDDFRKAVNDYSRRGRRLGA